MISYLMPLAVSDEKKAVQLYWDERSLDYDAGLGHRIRSDEKAAWRGVLKLALPETGLSVLDIGCGTGELSLMLAEMGNDVVGIDLSENLLDQARSKAKSQNLQILFESGDADDLPFIDDHFDAVICRHLLWTLPNPINSLKEWKRVTKMDGRLVIIDSEWRSGSIYSRLKWAFSDLGILVIDRANPWKLGYSSDLRSWLPHPSGLPFRKAREYMEASGLINLASFDLKDIRKIQMKGLPLRHRLALSRKTYLISGLKGDKS